MAWVLFALIAIYGLQVLENRQLRRDVAWLRKAVAGQTEQSVFQDTRIDDVCGSLANHREHLGEISRKLFAVHLDHDAFKDSVSETVRSAVKVIEEWKGVKNEVRGLHDRVNQCEHRANEAAKEVSKGHHDQCRIAHALLRDMQRVFGMLAAEYKPKDNPQAFTSAKDGFFKEMLLDCAKNAPHAFRLDGLDKLDQVEAQLKKPEAK